MRQFIESLKRLYQNGKVNEEKVIELFECGKITEDEKNYVLSV